MASYFSAALFLVALASCTPIVMLVNNLEHIDTVTVDYRGGLRYPHLQRVAATPDRLAAILAQRKAEPGR